MFLWCSYGISLISIYKHYANNIADPSSMQDACHMNFVIDLTVESLWSLCGSVVERWSAESEGLRFDSSWRLRIFSLSHAHDKMKKTSFSIIKIVQQTEWKTTNDLGKLEQFFCPSQPTVRRRC